MYKCAQQYDDAIVQFQTLLQKSSYQKEALYLIAECFNEKGLTNAARESLEKILTLDYSYKDVKEKLETLTYSSEDKQTHPEASDYITSTTHKMKTFKGERYEIIEELGKGGMGIVYKAKDTKLGRIVAIKALAPHMKKNKQDRERFLREAKAIALINHRNIINIYDITDDEAYIVMEFADGGTLRHLMKRGLEIHRAWELLIQVTDALIAAHNAGIIHRDIKPENILLTHNGEVRLTDFGIAHFTGSTITHEGAQVGTLRYMAPEQIRGEAVDNRCDIYALGIMAYEMLIGQSPFPKGDVAYHHIHIQPTPPTKVRPDLPELLDDLLLTCLEKNPDNRYQSMENFKEVLLQLEYEL